MVRSQDLIRGLSVALAVAVFLLLQDRFESALHNKLSATYSSGSAAADGKNKIHGGAKDDDDENKDLNDPSTPLGFLPRVTGGPLSKGQAKRGYTSMITQLAKPLVCAKRSLWRGPNRASVSVETRLDEALSKRSQWNEAVDAAVARCANGYPMMEKGEAGLVFHVLREGDLMLEWGSGRSSCVWATVVGELHSVDDSSTWVGHLRGGNNMMENQALHWMPSFEAAGGGRPPSSLDEYHLYMNLPFFIAPSCFKQNNVKFDVILVDGRVRPQCAYQALLLLKQDGVLIIHDWETTSAPLRPFYRIVLRWYELLHTDGRTAVFRIKPEKSAQEHHANPGVFPSWWTAKQSLEKWNMMDPNKLAYSEPFETPGPPTPEEQKRLKANWEDVKSQPGFVRYDL